MTYKHKIYIQFKKYEANIYVTITQVKKENKATSHQKSSLSCPHRPPGNHSPDFQDNNAHDYVPISLVFATYICIPFELYINRNILHKLLGGQLFSFNFKFMSFI